MNKQSVGLSDTLYQYVLDVSSRETPLLRRLREETAHDPLAVMQISPDQGQFMSLLVRLMNARRTIEIGVFTGYSSICVTTALPDDGQLVACDINEQWTRIAQRYWKEAGVAHKISLHLAPALDTLDALLRDGQAATYDFIFIDADKINYRHYYERGLQLLRAGGLVVVDNVLWGGSVADSNDNDANTVAIRAFNQFLHRDDRVDLSLVPIGDGLTLARKR